MTRPELPKRVLYALNSLCCLVPAQGPVRAREVARCTGIPPAEAAKILSLLVWGGFASSRRGSKGGFWLRRPASRIRVGDVMKFLSAPLDLGSQRNNDPVLRIWQEAAAPSQEAFNRFSLEDLVKRGNAAQMFCCQPAFRGQRTSLGEQDSRDAIHSFSEKS